MDVAIYTQQLIDTSLGNYIDMGGPRSGHRGHKGRKGKRGGSLPGKGGGGTFATISAALEGNATDLGNIENFELKAIAGSSSANLWITPKGKVYQVSEHERIGIETPPITFANMVRTGWGRAGYRAGQAFIDTIHKDHAILVLSRIAQQRKVKTFAWTKGWQGDVPLGKRRLGPTLDSILG